jgi:cell division protein FtsQ
MANRRKKRSEYLLDVKVQTQGRLRRRARWVAAVVATMVIVSFTTYGMWRLMKFAVARLVFENPRFAVAQIVVKNDGGLTPVQVAQLAGVRVAQNIFSLDLAQAQKNLEMVPLIRRVEVRRVLPEKIFIHVDERVAVARLRLPGRDASDSTFLLDRAGVAMRPVTMADGSVLHPASPGMLPILTGVSANDVHVGRPVESEQIYRALELIDRLEQAAAGAMMEVEQIDLSRPRQLVLATRQHTVVKFDVENFQPQLRRLSAILIWAQQRQKLAQTVDLTVNRGVPVTFAN